jgi:DNA helicase-2/ATP-dependent DNA helicase PcrA
LTRALQEATAPGTAFPEVVAVCAEYYRPLVEDLFDDYQRRWADIDSLVQIAKSYQSIESFLVDLVAIEPAEKSVGERIDLHLDVRPLVLSTIHSAKGLEWQVVFVLGVADGHLPISYSLNSADDIEEERRLLYVAITRSKQDLFLTMAHEGIRGGIRTYARLSRFLDEPDVVAVLDMSGSSQKVMMDQNGMPLMGKEELIRKVLGEAEGDPSAPQ